MLFNILVETAPGSGHFHLTTDTVDSDKTLAAFAIVTQQFADGVRRGLLPYQALTPSDVQAAFMDTGADPAGMPASIAAVAAVAPPDAPIAAAAPAAEVTAGTPAAKTVEPAAAPAATHAEPAASETHTT